MMKMLQDQRGSALVLVALAISVLIGFTALAVDGGNLFFRHTKLQDTADAVALAAAREVVLTSGNDNQKKKAAFTTATEYADHNGLTPASSTTNPTNVTYATTGEDGSMKLEFANDPGTGEINTVVVRLLINTNQYFAKIFGNDTVPVRVSATVLIGPPEEITGNLVPIGILDPEEDGVKDDYPPGVEVGLTLTPGGGEHGNYAWLNFTSVPELDDWIENGYNGTLNVGDTVETKEGVSVGNAGAAVENRIDGCPFDDDAIDAAVAAAIAGGSVLTQEELVQQVITDHLDSEPDCPRMVYTPVVDSIDSSGTVLGFAAFFITDYVHHPDAADPDLDKLTVTGYFIDVAVDASDITPSYSGNAKVIKLVN